jgi:hypothetical protein
MIPGIKYFSEKPTNPTFGCSSLGIDVDIVLIVLGDDDIDVVVGVYDIVGIGVGLLTGVFGCGLGVFGVCGIGVCGLGFCGVCGIGVCGLGFCGVCCLKLGCKGVVEG